MFFGRSRILFKNSYLLTEETSAEESQHDAECTIRRRDEIVRIGTAITVPRVQSGLSKSARPYINAICTCNFASTASFSPFLFVFRINVYAQNENACSVPVSDVCDARRAEERYARRVPLARYSFKYSLFSRLKMAPDNAPSDRGWHDRISETHYYCPRDFQLAISFRTGIGCRLRFTLLCCRTAILIDNSMKNIYIYKTSSIPIQLFVEYIA